MKVCVLISALALTALVAACGWSEPTPTLSPSPTPAPTPTSTLNQDLQLIFDDPQRLMADVLGEIIEGNSSAALRMGASGDVSFIPVLIEFMRFPWLLDHKTKVALRSSLAALIGQPYDELSPEQFEWDWWVEWLGEHPEVQPPQGFAGWKGRLFSKLVGPQMGAFLYDGVKARVRLEEIVWGGVTKDGIPDLTNPPVLSSEEATYLFTSDRVFGVSINGEHRAYPLRILNFHEMVNDVVGGVPFALAY